MPNPRPDAVHNRSLYCAWCRLGQVRAQLGPVPTSMCEHECLCVGPGGALQCCPGPAAQCPPPTTSTTTTLPGPLTWFYTCDDPVCGGDGAHPGASAGSPGAGCGTARSPVGATRGPRGPCKPRGATSTSGPR